MQYAKLRTVLKAWKGERSETAAAALLGVAPNTLGNWTDGASLPPSTRIPGLASVLGMPTEQLRAIIGRERKSRRGESGKGHARRKVGRGRTVSEKRAQP